MTNNPNPRTPNPRTPNLRTPNLRTAAGFGFAIGRETTPGRRAASLTDVTLTAERFAPIAVRRRRRDLGAGPALAPSRFIRGHIEADITALASLDHLMMCLPLITGSRWQARRPSNVNDAGINDRFLPDLDGDKRWLQAGTAAPHYHSLIRRYDPGDGWQAALGMKCRELSLSFDGFGEASLAARFAGMTHQTIAASAHDAGATNGHGPVNFTNDGASLRIGTSDGETYVTGPDLTRHIMVSSLSLHVARHGSGPLFAMHGDTPFAISDAPLGVRLTLRLLATGPAMRLLAVPGLLRAFLLVLPGPDGVFILDMGALQITSQRSGLAAGGAGGGGAGAGGAGLSMITLECELLSPPSLTFGIMRVAAASTTRED